MLIKQSLVHGNHFEACPTTGLFEGYANIFNMIDSHGDVVQRGAFKKSLLHWKNQGKFPKMLWQHDTSHVIGVWSEMYEDSKGLYVKGQLLMDIEKAREAHVLLQSGAIDSMSIGYVVKDSSVGQFQGKKVTFLNEIDLLEVSLVTFAANVASRIESVKSKDNATSMQQQREIRALCRYIERL